MATTRPPIAPVISPTDDESNKAEKEAVLDEIFKIEEANREIRTRNDFRLKRYDSDMDELPKIRRRMFDSIFNTLTEQSKARLREQDANFLADVENEKEPLLLWASIKATHAVINTGTPALDKLQSLTSLLNVKMKGCILTALGSTNSRRSTNHKMARSLRML